MQVILTEEEWDQLKHSSEATEKRAEALALDYRVRLSQALLSWFGRDVPGLELQRLRDLVLAVPVIPEKKV